jgi:pimeloyl-ACP methyl ester carboxylesterase
MRRGFGVAGRAALAGAIALLLVWTAGSVVARPVNRAVTPPAPPGRLVALTADDGVAIAASYWPGSRPDAPAVLLLHGVNNTRAMFAEQTAWLNRLGYAVMAIDFRGHGASAPVERSFGWREAADAAAAVAWLRRTAPRRKVAVIGVSQGGAAALLGPDGPLDADALVLHAVYPDLRKAVVNRLARSGSLFLARLSEPLLSYQAYARLGVAPERISPLAALRRYDGPVLIVGGTADLDTTVEDSRALHAAARGPKSLWLVEGADHVEVSKLWSGEYRRRVRCFLHRGVGEPGRHLAGAGELDAPCATSPSS